MAISGGDGSIILDTKVDTKGLNSGLNSMKGAITKIGGLLAAAFSVKILTNFVKESRNLYKIQMENEVKLATVMRQRMKATDDEIKSMLELASAQQQIGIIGDEVQLAGLQQIATFAKNKESIEALLPAMNNLIAQQYGFEASTESARNVANLMGKALQGQVGALTRVGITFDATEEAMLKTGNEMERAAALAQIITNNVGEMNTALAQTDVGRQQQLANTWGDIKEQFGAAFQQIAIIALPVLNAVAKALAWVASIARMVAQTIANMFGMKTSGGGGKQNTGISGLSTSTEKSADGMKKLGNATEKAGKQAKKSTSSFDDLQILTENAASSAGKAAEGIGEMGDVGSSIGGDVGTGFDFGIQADVDTTPLENALNRIVEIAKTIWDSTPVQTFVEAAKTTLDTLWNFITTMWGDIQRNASMTWQNIRGDLQTIGGNLVKLWTSYWSDFNDAVKTWGQPIINSISKLFNSIWSTAIDPAVKFITTAWADFTEILVELWNEHGTSLLDNIGKFAYTTTGLFQSIYDNVLEPIITPFLEQLSWLWEKHLSKMVGALGDFITSLTNGALEIYNEFIAPLVNNLLEKLAPAWSFLSELVIGVAGTILGTISDLVTGLIEALTGLIDFIVGVFTDDWKKVWEGVASVFKGIWEGIWGVAKGIINLIIDALNSFIAGINKIKFDVPEWVPILGGKQWGFNIPKIPKLAQGGVIPPNREFLAVLGDQKHGTNIEAPLTTIEQAVRNVLSEGYYGDNSGDKTIILQLDGREVGRTFGNAITKEHSRTGKSFIKTKLVFG